VFIQLVYIIVRQAWVW